MSVSKYLFGPTTLHVTINTTEDMQLPSGSITDGEFVPYALLS